MNFLKLLGCSALLALLVQCSNPQETTQATGSNHQELVQFFQDWRQFHQPKMMEGVPDYSKTAMEKRHADLKVWQERLANFDTTGWTIPEQVDWYMVWAEMNGLDFAHRVKKPWERDPAFYVWFYLNPSDVPEREGPSVFGAVEYPNYAQPLSVANAAEIQQRLTKAEAVYAQAKTNLTGNAKDLWIAGARSIREQGEELSSFAEMVEDDYPELAKEALNAKKAAEQFAVWLDEQAPSKTGISGVGKENYTWNLQKVHLLPHTWESQKLMLERELYRSHSTLRLREHHNREYPIQEKMSDAETFKNQQNDAVTAYIKFLEEQEIVTVKPYFDQALRNMVAPFTPEPEDGGPRGFFWEIIYRDGIVMMTHFYHWIELARLREEPYNNPIRQTPMLYNIFDSRAEGLATAMEELMLNAGFVDDRPRSDELVWILLAQRCARGLGALYQHGHEKNLQEAAEFASKWTPRGLLPANGSTIQHEEHFYLQQPSYGTSYVTGKLELDRLIAEYARQRNGNFSMKEFMDELNQVGIIPISLVYWEMTGDKSMLEAALK